MSAMEMYSVELKERQFDYLKEVAKKYGLPDEHKALRCLINYAIAEKEQEASIFDEIRCMDCG